MLNNDPVALHRSAAARAVAVAEGVRPDQLALPTPCAEWTVQDLIDHMVGGTEYLLAAVDDRAPEPREATTAADLAAGIDRVQGRLADPAVLARTCTSPLGFPWTVGEATAGTFMDLLVHTWDLARATGQDEGLDPELVEACVAMFLPAMPERGREAGLVGPAVAVAADAPAQHRLLGAMGRRP